MKPNTLKDGHGTTISFTGHSFTLILDPTSITPPGVDGGDKIDTTTHSNEAVRTSHPRTLKEITDASFSAAYDPGQIDDILAAINDNVQIVFETPDEYISRFFGYLKSFTPKELVEGQMPVADCTIVITNDHNGTETGPSTP